MPVIRGVGWVTKQGNSFTICTKLQPSPVDYAPIPRSVVLPVATIRAVKEVELFIPGEG